MDPWPERAWRSNRFLTSTLAFFFLPPAALKKSKEPTGHLSGGWGGQAVRRDDTRRECRRVAKVADVACDIQRVCLNPATLRQSSIAQSSNTLSFNHLRMFAKVDDPRHLGPQVFAWDDAVD